MQNYAEMKRFGIDKKDAKFFLPPYEWYNDSIVSWTNQLQLQLINYTPGTLTHADYTTPGMKNYRSSEAILRSVHEHQQKQASGLNGFILLMHIGAGPERKDKFYDKLPELLNWLRKENYRPVAINNLLRE